jgi:hypothetical protein
MVRSTPLSFAVFDRVPSVFLYQGCRISGTRKHLLGTRQSMLPDYFVSFNRHASIYSEEHVFNIPDYVVIVYELPLLPTDMIQRLKHFYTNREQCVVSTGYLALRHRPGGEWANTKHRKKLFTILFSNRW